MSNPLPVQDSLIHRMFRKLRPVAVVLAMLVPLSGCYLPIFFDAEIELTRAGYFKMTFDGYLSKVELHDKLRKNEITPAEEAADVEAVRTDFTRDTSTKIF